MPSVIVTNGMIALPRGVRWAWSSSTNRSKVSGVSFTRRSELWLLEDMSFAVVANARVQLGDGDFVSEYRCLKTKDLAQWLAKERLVSFIGSDMHGRLPKRTPRMKEGIAWLYRNMDKEYADAVCFGNAVRMLIAP